MEHLPIKPVKFKFKDKSFFEMGLIGEKNKIAYVLLCAKDGRKATMVQIDLDQDQLLQIQDFIDKITETEGENA